MSVFPLEGTHGRTAVSILAFLPALVLAVSASAQTNARPLPGLQTGPAPWTRGLSGLSQRLEAIGLPAMPAESFVQHIHQHLTITIRGTPTMVPAMIGINEMARYISPIHTHDTTGTIHIEAATKDVFTLGQFFDVWGVRFSAQCVGGYCAKGGESVMVLLNGLPVPGDPRRLALQDRQEISVTFGDRGKGGKVGKSE